MNRSPVSRVLAHYFCGAYLLLLALCLPYFRRAWSPDLASSAYALALGVSQAALYLAPAFLLTRLASWLLVGRRAGGTGSRAGRISVYFLAIFLTTVTAAAIQADALISEIFGFHLNGFVLNLLTTPGGIESMGMGSEGLTSFVRAVAILTAAHAVILWGALRMSRMTEAAPRQPVYRWAMVALVLIALGERANYAVGEVRSDGEILAQAATFPLYFPITARTPLLAMGIGTERSEGLPDLDPGSSRLAYPLSPIRVDGSTRPPNIVWLVGESLRWDMLDPDIMPAAFDLSRGGWRFTQHYSGGNGTRMGMFSMFYGIHGPYWFEFLKERRSPVLVDVLQQQGYQLGLFTSARFSYPEFDRTIFANVPASSMRESNDNYHAKDWDRGWTNDRDRVTDLLGFLEGRDRERPFFTFMFFESTHFRYYFPDESVIRTPYAKELSLDELGSEENVELSRARYINAAHHLDQQVARILDVLRREGELERTIIIITGDHGEEFYEKGRRGHNSEFHEEQIHVPLVLWIPGDGGHVVDRMTSHIDLPATILPLVGVRNPAEDYSLGHDLRGTEHSPFNVVSDWSRIGIFDATYKLTLPLSGVGLLLTNTLTTREDRPVDNAGAAYRQAEPALQQTIAELHRFRRTNAGRQVTAALPSGQ